jgi:hypothetical protein
MLGHIVNTQLSVCACSLLTRLRDSYSEAVLNGNTHEEPVTYWALSADECRIDVILNRRVEHIFRTALAARYGRWSPPTPVKSNRISPSSRSKLPYRACFWKRLWRRSFLCSCKFFRVGIAARIHSTPNRIFRIAPQSTRTLN